MKRLIVLAGVVVTLSCWAVAASWAAAVETELREFNIEVDGKPAGQYTMKITKQDDGVLSMKADADIKFKYLFGTSTYTYSYDGVEHWKSGRLLQLSSKCDDDGTKMQVSAVAAAETLQVTVNGKQRNCRWDVVTTSYWMTPDPRYHDAAVPLLDADTGKEYVGQLKKIGVEAVQVGGQQQNCYHFRVTGGPTTPVDLWYDGQNRLVKQEFTEQGKHVVFVLRAVRR
ncbi:MAG TPA: DUF6134 family protein [Gemmataceae bacterium]|nr:DUF6134 family protein [Gemmataceae bacterium]